MDGSKRANAPTPSATTAPDLICATRSVCSRSSTDCTASGTSRETASGCRSHSASSNVTGAESGPRPPSGREPNSPSRYRGEPAPRASGGAAAKSVQLPAQIPLHPTEGPMKLAVEVIGWAGALLILGAYALLSAGRLQAESLAYHPMDILGALRFVGNSGGDGDRESTRLNPRHRQIS